MRNLFQFIAGLCLSLVFITSGFTVAQDIGDYRSRATGNWNVGSTWETFDGAEWISNISAFPNVAATNTSTKTTLTAGNHTVNLPAGIGAGDLLLIFWADAETVADDFATPTGWTELYSNTISNRRHKVWYKIAEGTEGTTLVVGSSAERSAHNSMRIAAGSYTGVPVASTIATGSSNSPDSPSLTSGFGAVNTLWISTSHMDNDDGGGITSPTNYGSQLSAATGTTGGSTANARMLTSRRELSAATENPGAYGSVSATVSWTAVTIAIQSAPVTGTPTSASGVTTILNGHNVTVTANVSVDQVVVNSGGTLTVGAATLTIANGAGIDLDVSGTLATTTSTSATITISGGAEVAFNDGAQYNHARNGSSIPAATWHANSTVNITGVTNTAIGGLDGQTFGHFIWNSNQSGTITWAASFTVAGNMSVLQTGGEILAIAGATTARTVDVNGNFTISATNGTFTVVSGTGAGTLNVGGNFSKSGNGIFILKSSSGAAELNVTGDFSMTAGTFTHRSNATGTSVATIGGSFSRTGGTYNMSSVAAVGVLNIAGDFTNGATGSLTESSTGSGSIVFNGTNPQSFTNSGSITTEINWTVNSGAIVNLNSNMTVIAAASVTVNGRLNMGTNLITGDGSFVLSDGGILGIGHAQGITSSGATGNVQVAGTRNYGGGAHYIYNGSVAQVLGNGLPQNITGELEIDNPNGVTMEPIPPTPYPVVAATNTSFNSGNTTPHTVNLPAGIQAGDLLLIFWADRDDATTLTTPSGWTALYNSISSDFRAAAFYRIADGTEGATISMTTSAGERSAHITYRIAAGTYVGVPLSLEASNVATGSSTAPDPLSLAPTWGNGMNLWIAASHGANNTSMTSAPADFTNLIYSQSGGSATSNSTAFVSTAIREFEGTSLDPGAFTLAASRIWLARTVAIQGTGVVDTTAITLSFNSELTFTNGNLYTGINTVDLGTSGTITGEANGSYLVGNLTSTRTVGTSLEDFGGIGATILAGSSSLGVTTILRKSGPGEEVTGNYGESSISRTWEVEVTTQPSNFRDIKFDWVSDDNNGNNAHLRYIGIKSPDGSAPWWETGSFASNNQTITLRVFSFSTFSVISKDPLWYQYGFGNDPGFIDEGESTNFLPPTSTNGGSTFVSIGSAGEGFWELEDLSIIELTEPWGDGISLTGAAATGNNPVNKFSIINFSGTEVLTLRFDVVLEGGPGEWYFYAGNGATSTSFTGTSLPSVGNNDYFVALRWILGENDEIATSYYSGATSDWVPLNSASFVKGGTYTVDMYINNSSWKQGFYFGGGDLDPFFWDLYVNNTPVGLGLAKAAINNREMINSIAFIGRNSPLNDAIIHIDAINYGRYFDESAAPLPVELTSFTAKVVGPSVKLNWRTETETMNYGFDVERKAKNESEWKKVGFVEGFGNSNSPKDYSYTDKNVKPNIYSYRLKQIDTDGQYEYSKVVEVEFNMPKEFALSQNYPNPFNPSTKITFSIPVTSNVSLQIYNILGQKVMDAIMDQVYEAGVYEYNFDGTQLSSGIYLYTIQAGKFVQTKKMLMIK